MSGLTLTAPAAAAPGSLPASLALTRDRLYRAVLAARPLAALAALVVIGSRRGVLADDLWPLAGAWTAYLVWATGTAVLSQPVIAILRRRPWILAFEQAVLVALLLGGGQVRAITIYLCAAPVVLATLAVSTRWALGLAAADSLAVAGVFLSADRIGAVVGTEPATATVWAPGLAGLFAAVGLFVYVRVLLERLETATAAAADRQRESLAAHRAQARAEAQQAAMVAFAGRVSPRVPALLAAIDRVGRRHAGEPAWDEQVSALRRLAGGIDSNLGRIVSGAASGGDSAPVAQIVTAAAAAAVALGAGGVACSTGSADGLALTPSEADALRRFVTEAVVNAWKHGAPPIEVSARAVSAGLVVSVRDHGAGIPDPDGAARGLGLDSLARDADLLRGRLSIEPASPGTVVTLRMPAGG